MDGTNTYGRRDETQGAEYHRKVNFSPDATRCAPASNEPNQNRRNGADEKGPYQRPVKRPFPKESMRADDAPENTAVEVYSRDRTGESVDSFRGADARNIGKHPVQDSNLRHTGHQRRSHLDFE